MAIKLGKILESVGFSPRDILQVNKYFLCFKDALLNLHAELHQIIFLYSPWHWTYVNIHVYFVSYSVTCIRIQKNGLQEINM